jgi:D-inositol-3-phosphate glycosyltransferase
MRVTLCSLSSGGIAHYSYALATALEQAGIATNVLMHDFPAYDLAGFPHAHRPVVGLQMGISRRTRLTSPLRNLYGVLGTTRTSDVVHYQWALGPRNDRLHWPLLRRLGKKIVLTAHDVLPHEPEVLSLEHCRWLYDTADAVIVHGVKLKELMLERFGTNPASVHVIPVGNFNFVADTPGPWSRENARKSLGYDERDRVVLFFGLIRPYKGLDDLIKACRIVNEEGLGDGRRLKLLIAGRVVADQWKQGGYDELLDQGKLRAQTHLSLEHIEVRDIARFFHASDVVAVPYKRGSQSGVLQLAYSFGKPSVATRVGSVHEAIQAGETARLVPPEDPPAFAQALRELLLDDEAAQRLGARGRNYADTALSWGPIVQKTREIYESI